MNIVVDTSVWSLILRRHTVDEANPHVQAFRNHLEQGDGLNLIGNILQELLDGLKEESDRVRLISALNPFPLLPLIRETYILASTLRGHCRKKGIQASPVDFLIAAACIEHSYPLLTADHDFHCIAQHCDLTLS